MLKKIIKTGRSQKGDAIILLSVLVTGIILLVTAVVVESLRRSGELQSVQKESIQNLYKAEEGIEYSLYDNKNKYLSNYQIPSAPFKIKVYENNVPASTSSSNLDAYEILKKPAQNRNIVVTSENDSLDPNDNTPLKRTVFANIPVQYYDQVPLWDCRNGCVGTNCGEGSDLTAGSQKVTFQEVINSADYQKGTCPADADNKSWCGNNSSYRFVFICKTGNCTVSNLKIGIGCDFSQCTSDSGISGCPSYMDLAMSQASGRVITSQWFQYFVGNSTEPTDLRYNNDPLKNNSKILVQFDLENGTMEEVTGLANSDPMCKKESGTWSTLPSGSAGGMCSFEFRKEKAGVSYRCADSERVCENAGCNSSHQECINGEKYYCDGYPQNDSQCGAEKTCCNGGGILPCSNYCAKTCNPGGERTVCDDPIPGDCYDYCHQVSTNL